MYTRDVYNEQIQGIYSIQSLFLDCFRRLSWLPVGHGSSIWQSGEWYRRYLCAQSKCRL